MFLLRLLILIFMLNEHIAFPHRKCSKGQKISGNGCEACPLGYYQDTENVSKSCRPCTKCDNDSGSIVKEDCTIYKNTKCQCRENFVLLDNDSSVCQCDKGYGLKRGKCEKCEEGFFSSEPGTPCTKWTECKSGVNIRGTPTSDVICNEPNSNTYITTPPTSNKITSLRSLTTQRPHGGAQTQRMHTTSATTAPQVINFTRKPPAHPPYIGSHIGMALLIFGIVGLLVLTAVTCKLHITECCHRQKSLKPGDSLCRRPVEESCDGSQSPLKQILEEP